MTLMPVMRPPTVCVRRAFCRFTGDRAHPPMSRRKTERCSAVGMSDFSTKPDRPQRIVPFVVAMGKNRRFEARIRYNHRVAGEPDAGLPPLLESNTVLLMQRMRGKSASCHRILRLFNQQNRNRATVSDADRES